MKQALSNRLSIFFWLWLFFGGEGQGGIFTKITPKCLAQYTVCVIVEVLVSKREIALHHQRSMDFFCTASCNLFVLLWKRKSVVIVF